MAAANTRNIIVPSFRNLTEVELLDVTPVCLSNILTHFIAEFIGPFFDIAAKIEPQRLILQILLPLGLHITDEVNQLFNSITLLF